MMRLIFIQIFFSLLISLMCFSAQASTAYFPLSCLSDTLERNAFPTPKDIKNLLFYIQRDPNTNTVCYTLNVDEKGYVNSPSPVNAFWIRYPEGGQHKSLNFIQRTFAYGIEVKTKSSDQYELRSVAYDKMALYLRKDKQGDYHIYTQINHKECILHRIFIRIDGGSMWSPNVLYIELSGTDTTTGKDSIERIKIS
ncbi:DUF4833 domain-containing protein [Parapedobacter tibetensis]|uniref:DUF4833 domain-containing protein n=1 Tax=Parapedobacter tibetensis TaxID=2972951 RepID=UPI00214DEC02|nr:DUF4833 domain-containing protein [Parapedobacter tibetensis]